jgi:single-stranded DNA-binding protein
MASSRTNLNTINILGRLTADPITKEINTAKGPMSVTSMRLKVPKRAGAGFVFIDVEAYGTKSALAQRLREKRRVIVIGSLDMHEYLRQDNTKVTVHKIIADDLVFIDDPEDQFESVGHDTDQRTIQRVKVHA